MEEEEELGQHDVEQRVVGIDQEEEEEVVAAAAVAAAAKAKV